MTVLDPALRRALSAAAGIDLASYRGDFVRERVRRALERECVPDVALLVRRLSRDAAARTRFRRSLAISVSGVFRDPDQFELLQRELLPAIVARGGVIRVWSAGSADGSELFSVGVVLDRLGVLDRATLLGSDLLEDNIHVAVAASWPADAAAGRVAGRLRFEQRDLLRDGAPPGRWDLVLCRNVAIYLEPGARRELHTVLARALASNGVLLVGRSERIADAAALGLVRVAPHAYTRQA